MVSSISSKPSSLPQISQQSTVARPTEARVPSAAPVDANKAAQLLRNSLIGQDSFQATGGGRRPVDLGQTSATDSSGLGGLGELEQLLGSLLEQLSSGDTEGAQESLATLLKALGIEDTDSAEEASGTESLDDSGTLESTSGVDASAEASEEGGLESLLQTLSELATKSPELLKQLVQNPELLKAVAQNPQVLQQLATNPEQLTSLTGGASQGSSPLGELSGLSRFLGSGSFSPQGI
jgi:hypothetical protein